MRYDRDSYTAPVQAPPPQQSQALAEALEQLNQASASDIRTPASLATHLLAEALDRYAARPHGPAPQAPQVDVTQAPLLLKPKPPPALEASLPSVAWPGSGRP